MNWLREQMKTIIWIIVVAFVATIFASWGLGGFGGPREQHVASVDGEKISMTDFQQQLSRQRELYRQEEDGPIDSETRQRLRREAFKEQVNQVLLRRLLQRAGGEATREAVREWLTARPEFRDETGRFDPELYQRFLDEVSPARQQELIEGETERIETMRVTGWLENMVDFTDTEARLVVEDAVREKQVHGIFIRPEEYVDAEVVENYYEANQDEFTAPPRAYVRQLKLETPDEDAPDYRERLAEVNERLEQIQRRHSIGDDFSELARDFSTDTATAPEGGLLGWLTPDELEDEVRRVVFDLQPGEISELVRRDDGYYLFYLEEADFDRQLPLEEVEGEIRSRFVGEEEKTRAEEEAQELFETILESSHPPEEITRRASDYHGLAAANDGDYGWLPAELIVPALVEDPIRLQGELAEDRRILPEITARLRSLERGEVSEPFCTEFGCHLLAVTDSRSPALDRLTAEDMDEIVGRLQEEKIQSYFDSWLARERERVQIELEVSPEQVGDPPT